MTRFARAKGSKASNERVPENPTPWNVMREDLQKSQNEASQKRARDKMNKVREKNYKQFINESESKTEKKWSKFPNSNISKVKNIKKKDSDILTLIEEDDMLRPDPEVDTQLKNIVDEIEEVLIKDNCNNKKNTLKKKKNRRNEEAVNNKSNKMLDDLQETAKIEKKEIKVKNIKKKKNIMKTTPLSLKMEKKIKENEIANNKNQALKKEQKKKNNESETNSKENIKKKQMNSGKNQKNRNKFEKNENNNLNGKRKMTNERCNKEYKRRKVISDTSIIVNGETKEIVLYNGFPILKSEEERISNLKKSLVSKGVSRDEVNRTIKLERRRAEKSLSRIKKLMCYNCRQMGHLLSECPEIKNDNATKLIENVSTGICFKCGSTEHTYRECKVNKEFNFAKCFICREQGHIAKQCPDNPRGIYPKGGACKLCGDVTHLKKDCPKFQEEQKHNYIALDTISNENIESIDKTTHANKTLSCTKQKLIKF